MTTDLIVARLDGARKLLAEASNATSAKRVADLAHAAEIYARRQKLSEESIRYAHSLKVEALALLGEFLRRAEKNKGAAGGGRRDGLRGAILEPRSEQPPTLDDLGLSKKESSEAQQLTSLAANSPSLFEHVKSGELSLTQAKREFVKANAPESPPFPTGKYRVFYADPPWQYGNTQPDYHFVQDDHYPTMSLDALCAMPVKDIAEDNAVLFLWVTSPILAECFQVVKAWGFAYKSSFVWDKVKHNMGHYNSVRHELLLVCVRGSCQPDTPKLFDSVVTEERTTHSAKPAIFRQMIEELYTHGEKVELFARAQHAGWLAYGNECQQPAIPGQR